MSQIIVSMDGTLLNWLKNVGDSVNKGDIVAEIEADKATVEVEAPESGVISALNANAGDVLTTGQIIGMIGDTSPPNPLSTGGEGAKANLQPVVKAAEAGAPAGQAARTNGAPASAAKASAQVTTNGHIKASPLAKKLAEERGIDLAQVPGTGPGGRIVKEDVEGFVALPVGAQQAAPLHTSSANALAAPAARKLPEGADVEYIDLTNMRKRIAQVTVESKQWTPHFYVTTEIDVEPLLALRKQINEGLTEEEKISVNDMVVKAAALTLRQYPNLNSHYYGDRFARHKRINIGIAVALPNGGLLNVVAQDADTVSLKAMAQHNKEMFARAREGKVKPEDIMGATFTVSNLGPYNVEHFLAIINPPEAAILAVGTAMKVPVVKADGTLGVGNRMKVTISVDHRVSDGAEGAQFLQAFKALLETPMRMLI
jgi:pyruvate dehydrogenase E2 component (dihydrolipoamide acetyltransferase)